MSNEGEHFNNGYAIGLVEGARRLGDLMTPEATARYRAVDLSIAFYRDQRQFEKPTEPSTVIKTAKLIESYLLGK